MEKYIAQCKFYKGEQANPFEKEDNNKAQFWLYEEEWVKMMLNNKARLDDYINHYISIIGDFDPQNDCPLSLKALIFERYDHWCGGLDEDTGADDFLSFFETYINL